MQQKSKLSGDIASPSEVASAEKPASSLPPPPPRENAVLVLGATGRLGRRVVQKVRIVAGAAHALELASSPFLSRALSSALLPVTHISSSP